MWFTCLKVHIILFISIFIERGQTKQQNHYNYQKISLKIFFSFSPGLFKGSTTTLDGIGLRPMPAERPKTLRKLKSVYDASPTDAPPAPPSILSSNGQATDRNINGVEDEVRRRSNTTSSTQSGDKSLSILSPFDEQVRLSFTQDFYDGLPDGKQVIGPPITSLTQQNILVFWESVVSLRSRRPVRAET
ncbi:hypothetical protein SFRURICE_011969 [Spodoptera frugiperda]|nr:hypothetical protein SFRURICE_011969 [Spodoptera frugiperda]